MTHVRGRTTSSADRGREFRARHQVGPRVVVRSAFGVKRIGLGFLDCPLVTQSRHRRAK
jgi:hypothetical protein